MPTPQVWAGLVVLITVVVYILSSQVPALASVPGTTYGYACTFAFLLQTPGKLDKAVLTSISLDNVVLVVPLSMAIGAVFGLASAKLAAFLTSQIWRWHSRHRKFRGTCCRPVVTHEDK